MYFVKTPSLLKRIFKDVLWTKPASDSVFLSFDDGPHPDSTPQLLALLDRLEIKASFFCLGNQVLKYPKLYRDIILAGHTVGLHGHAHLSGWKTSDTRYFEDIKKCRESIDSNLFRPPYGRLTYTQYKYLKTHYQIVLWDIMPGDFDPEIDATQLLKRITVNARPGSIIVLHDSPDTIGKLESLLPLVGTHFNSFNTL
jgi:peptidoglycan/xylan/chitin deacetylase (PgdA/CDA1 family)